MNLNFYRILCVVSVSLFIYSSKPCHAQQPISGSFAPGNFTGMKGGLTPQKGHFMVENGTLIYNNRNFVNSSGENLSIDPVNVLANRTVLSYVPNWDVLGGRYWAGAIIPFANTPIRPQPNSELAFQLSDIIIMPVGLGWTNENLHYQFLYLIWLPTGRFNVGASNNVGKGLVGHMISGAVTWLQPTELPWSATAALRTEILGKQKTTNIKPGTVMTIEGGVGKEVARGLDLGLTYYVMQQVAKEQNSPAGVDNSLYSASAIGPEINWRPKGLDGFQAAFRSYFEIQARNSSKGIFSVISLSYIWAKN